MKKKIKKVTPIKSETLCQKCVYDFDNHCTFTKCEQCKQHKEVCGVATMCVCDLIINGEKCEHFKRRLPSVQIGDFKYTARKNGMSVVYSPKDKKSEV